MSLPIADDGNPLLQYVTKYHAVIGMLLYLTITRPDIAFAVGRLSQFMQSPREVHWNGVFRYSKSAPEKCLLFKDNGHLNICGYSDADYEGAHKDRKSTTRYCSLLEAI
jgi:hypothetical protein